MAFCLVPKIADEFLAKIKSGEINPDKLTDMTSKQRRDFFASFMGEENAAKTNSLFESKLLLANKQQGILNWAKQVSGLKPEVLKDIQSRVAKMDERVLNAIDEGEFLEDLARQKLGVHVSMDEAKTIFDLSQKVESLKKSAEKSGPKSSERQAYGEALYDFQDYLSEKKTASQPKIGLEELKQAPIKTLGRGIGKGIGFVAGLSKSILTSLDNSALGTQGMKTFWSKNKIWRKNSIKSFQDIYDTFGGENVKRAVMGEILGRENAMNGLYKKHGVAIGNLEEAKPSAVLEKIPYVGKAFEASDNAFNLFQYRTRADIFDNMVQIAKETGGNLEGAGKFANSMTGRGNLGRLESSADTFNNLFFSPRFLKSQIDFFTAHAFDKNISPMVRAEAFKNMGKVLGGITATLGMAYIVNPKSVELNPTSSDFGKIKVGDTRYDVSGGLSSLVVLAARIISQQTKSTTTIDPKTKDYKITKLNTGAYGSRTAGDVFADFFANKLSPAAGIVRDVVFKGKDFDGNKPTVGSVLKNSLTPLPIKNAVELMDRDNNKQLSEPERQANILAGILADFVGIRTNTYSKKEKTNEQKNEQRKINYENKR